MPYVTFMRCCLFIFLCCIPLVGATQMLTVAQYDALTLDQMNTPIHWVVSHDSLSQALRARLPKEQPVQVVRLAQTMSAAAVFAQQPVPFPIASTQQLAAYLTQPFKDEKLKAWALYVWMGTHLTYDYDVYSKSRMHLVRHNALEVLLYGKSSCSGYANLYYELADNACIKVLVTDGLFKSKPNVGPGDHAWNLVKINGRWGNIDVICYNQSGFLPDPELFQESHYANLRQMRLAREPMSREEFIRLNGKPRPFAFKTK